MSPQHHRVPSPRKWRIGVVLAALVASTSLAMTDDAGVGPAAGGKERAVTVEPIAGSAVKRVVLSARAAQRLDIRTATIDEQAIVPTRVVGGVLVDPSAGGAASSALATAGKRAVPGIWVRVALSPPEWNALAKDKPARVLLLQPRAGAPKTFAALPNGEDPLDSAKSGMVSVFYVVPAGTAGVAVGDRARVELALDAGTQKQKVVPYSAVYYDAKGEAWVYVNTGPLAFVRQPVKVERVAGELAVLASGPDAGTAVATVGVPMLYGAEIFGK